MLDSMVAFHGAAVSNTCGHLNTSEISKLKRANTDTKFLANVKLSQSYIKFDKYHD